MAKIFGRKHDINNRASASEITRGPIHRFEMYFGSQMEPPFLLTLRKFCILLHYQASHTEVSKQKSIKRCDILGCKRNLQMRVQNLRGSPQKIEKLKTAYLVTVLISTKLS